MTVSPDPGTSVALGVLDTLFGYHLRRASSAFAVDFTRAVGDTGLRQVLFGILSIVAANPGINQGNVGRALGIRRANMVGLVTELVTRGLVHRDTAADDRRALALRLTPAGDTIVDTALARIRAHEDDLLHDLSAAERAQLIALIGRVDIRGAAID